MALHRRHGTFTDTDAKAVADIGGLLGQGIRRAIMRSALSAVGDDEQPGLIVLRRDDSVDSMTAAASRWLGELIDSTAILGRTPLTIVSIAQVARRAATRLSDETATVRLPRRTGEWMRLDASLLDRGEPGQVAVIISAAREPEVARLIAQAYGLSVREKDVTRLVLHGQSTVEMAKSLHLSPSTVQDHLKAIFGKVGVRSRRELVAKVFLQQCAPRLSNGALPSSDGWCIDDRPREGTLHQPAKITATIAHTSEATARSQRATRGPAN